MIQQLKNIIRKNEILFSFAKRLMLIKSIPLKDFLNFEKLWLFKKTYPYTMVGYARLSNVYELASLVERNKISGAFVECGVWRGGCIAVMAYMAQKFGSGRKIWLFDSFEGLPEPTAEDGKIAKDYAQNKAEGKLETINKCVGPLEDVKEIFFDILKINQNNVVIKKGWFQNSLPLTKQEIGKIAILRLDGDWYESTKVCLDNLYNNVIIGGYIVLDDYGYWEGAKRALDEFFVERKISPKLIKIDDTGVYFRKP